MARGVLVLGNLLMEKTNIDPIEINPSGSYRRMAIPEFPGLNTVFGNDKTAIRVPKNGKCMSLLRN
jgi:hypothetical protein